MPSGNPMVMRSLLFQCFVVQWPERSAETRHHNRRRCNILRIDVLGFRGSRWSLARTASGGAPRMTAHCKGIDET